MQIQVLEFTRKVRDFIFAEVNLYSNHYRHQLVQCNQMVYSTFFSYLLFGDGDLDFERLQKKEKAMLLFT